MINYNLIIENAATPYSAVVCINDMEYGSGFGSSKKQAKANAARKTLEILIPQMRDKISGDNTGDNGCSSRTIKASRGNSDTDLSFFDQISINDPRVAEFCAKTTEPSPHAILMTCLQRNYGLGDMHINYSVNTLKHQRNEFTMTVGKHEATVVSIIVLLQFYLFINLIINCLLITNCRFVVIRKMVNNEQHKQYYNLCIHIYSLGVLCYDFMVHEV